MSNLVLPHGGKLVDRIVSPEESFELQKLAESYPTLTLDARELADLELIATGSASPLTGFLGKADYISVLERLRLADGTVWPLPLNLAATDEQVKNIARGKTVALRDGGGRLWGVLDVTDVYSRDPLTEARAVYRTDDASHPGVAYLVNRPTNLIGGTLRALPLPTDLPVAKFRFTPAELRAKIEALGWKKTAGFHTQNPIHRADEHLTKLALELADGIVIHPLVGETNGDDVPVSVRFQTYELLIEKYYPKERTVLAAFPGAMRYAGPREAIFHAVVRKNYGITNIIAGRDTQEIFNRFSFEDLGVTPLNIEPTFFCKLCDSFASIRTCSHDAQHRVDLSETKVRETLRAGGHLPREFSRAEVAEVLRNHYVREAGALPPPPKADSKTARGFILWFTGLSGAGKSTLANAVHCELSAKQPIEILDGDEVRTYLSKGLSFSKEDRDTNIRRIGFVARLLARNGTPVITAAISPYKETRNEVRRLAEAEGIPFIEVYARASIEALAERDVKGLYKKAIAGEIQHFTGVNDPYEAPDAPDLTVYTDRDPVSTSLVQILDLLRQKGLIAAGQKGAAQST